MNARRLRSHCGSQAANWTWGPGHNDEKPHFYCHLCGAHYWLTQWYSQPEWFAWINSEEGSPLHLDGPYNANHMELGMVHNRIDPDYVETSQIYGTRMATRHDVYYRGYWWRVWCTNCSNSGTCFIEYSEGVRYVVTGDAQMMFITGDLY